jgi:hypothetical protein
LQITTADQPASTGLRQTAVSDQALRIVPGDRLFVTRLVVGINAADISTITEAFDVGAKTAADLANKAFTCTDGVAFGISGEMALTFGSFADDTGQFTLTTDSLRASGKVLLSAPATSTQSREAVSQQRQSETGEHCVFTITDSDFASGQGPQAGATFDMTCQRDDIDDHLRLQNLTTGAASLSAPPTLVVNTAPNGTIDTPTGDVTIAAEGTVAFTATCSDPDATTPFRFTWNFGGGAPSVFAKDPSPVQFATPGTFTVILTCTDALGVADPTSDTRTVMVIGSGIRGQVTTGATGAPVAALTVKAYHFDSGAFVAQTTTTATGTYLLVLPAGRYKVVALGTGQLATLWAGNVVDFDTAVPVIVRSVPRVDFALASGGAITGVVTGPDGTPIVGRSVDIFEMVREHFTATARTGTDSRFARGLAPRPTRCG